MDVGNATIIAAAIAAAVSLGSSVFAWCAANKSNKAAAQSNEVTNRTNREIAVFEQDEAEQKAKIDREQANELEYVDESQKSDAAESANASNGSAGGKPVRNPEREKPKWEDTITNRMLHWSYTPEQKEELRKALAVGVPKATILTYFYPDVTVEKMSSYRKK